MQERLFNLLLEGSRGLKRRGRIQKSFEKKRIIPSGRMSKLREPPDYEDHGHHEYHIDNDDGTPSKGRGRDWEPEPKGNVLPSSKKKASQPELPKRQRYSS
jgi:hypothetical protein